MSMSIQRTQGYGKDELAERIFLLAAWIALPVIQELARSPQRWRWLSTFRIHACEMDSMLLASFKRCFGKLGSL